MFKMYQTKVQYLVYKQLSSQSNVMHVHENEKELIAVQCIYNHLKQITTLNFNTETKHTKVRCHIISLKLDSLQHL